MYEDYLENWEARTKMYKKEKGTANVTQSNMAANLTPFQYLFPNFRLHSLFPFIPIPI